MQRQQVQTWKWFLLTLLSFWLLTGNAARGDTILETVRQSPRFTTLARAIDAANLEVHLGARSAKTFFAPTDAAFNRLPPGTLEELLKPERRETLASVLWYHVIPRRLSERSVMRLRSGTNLRTMNGETFAIRKGRGVQLDPFVSGRARILQTDVKASNGVIHVIDEVLIPPSLAYALARNPAYKNENW